MEPEYASYLERDAKLYELVAPVLPGLKARASELRRTLEDVQAVVAAWHELSSPPTPLKDAT